MSCVRTLGEAALPSPVAALGDRPGSSGVDKKPMLAAVFDGHGGVSAGQYLCKQLYEVLSDAIDEETYGEECSLEGRL